MSSILYTLILYPLIQIIELIFVSIDNTFYVHGFSIIGVSVCVTLLSLPLYVVAEKWQKIERDKQKSMENGVERIKNTFSGDERYMMLSTFYSQHHYHPAMALRATISLLIQVPFFLAAYIFLSNLQELKGSSFLFIKDLSSPDALFSLGKIGGTGEMAGNGGFSINVLPILMTIINIVAGFIYTKGLKNRDKIQVYAMAAVFLVILYNSPSGLCLYWTMNNILSLVKNIYYKLKSPLKALYWTIVAMFVALDAYFILKGSSFEKSGYIVAVSILVPLLPFIVRFFQSLMEGQGSGVIRHNKTRTFLFISSCAVFAVLTGLVTVSNVIVSSPQEFSFIDDIASPLFFVNNSFLQAIGAFFLWPVAIFFLFSKRTQVYMTVIAVFLAVSALVNTFIFQGHYGFISPLLVFESEAGFKVSVGHLVLNNMAIFAIFLVVVILLYYRKIKYILFAMILSFTGLIGLGSANCVKIYQEFKKFSLVYSPKSAENVEAIFHLSKTKKNVFVIMLDRAISGFVPTIFEEAPELKEKYSGFVYYPNTVSFGFFTLQGVPPLYGGYEYVPTEINKRTNEALVEKHNEALAVLPRLFSANGFETTVADAPWASYSWVSDMSYMENYPEKIRTLHTMKTYKSAWYAHHNDKMPKVQSILNKRNFIWYAVMCDLPYILRSAVYNDGDYWAATSVSSRNNMFLNSYSVLDFMPTLTASDGENGTFTIIANDATHDGVLCEAPDYVPVEKVENRGETQFANDEHYHANASALHCLSKWLDYLKSEGVYDNTRIIFVSDHGRDVWTGAFQKEMKLPFMREFCNPLLLVKDFNAQGKLKTDYTFMTNADVPSIAVHDLIENAKNPFTGKAISSDEKNSGITLTSTKNWIPAEQKKNAFDIAPNDWFSVRRNIFSEDNWEQVRRKR